MDLPVRVLIYCPSLELKNKPGRLIAITSEGYYEVLLDFKERSHTALLPIHGTALVFAEPNVATETMPDIVR